MIQWAAVLEVMVYRDLPRTLLSSFEPRGERAREAGEDLMFRRCVILQHDHPYLHWDFLLEEEASARTWRLLRKPRNDEPIAAEPLPAHRLVYLDYEGPVAGDRGRVARVFNGFYEQISSGPLMLELRLSGNSPGGTAQIRTLPDGRVFVEFHSLPEQGMEVQSGSNSATSNSDS
jgi:hypothetical protein